MPRLVITNGVQQGRAFPLKPGVNRIGRSSDNHFQIPDPSISNSHCEILLSDRGTLVRDLNSTNGTFINGEQVSEADLQAGQILQLGEIQMQAEEQVLPTDGSPVHVPELSQARSPVSVVLPDGSSAC